VRKIGGKKQLNLHGISASLSKNNFFLFLYVFLFEMEGEKQISNNKKKSHLQLKKVD
jgi:hypothetical protein